LLALPAAKQAVNIGGHTPRHAQTVNAKVPAIDLEPYSVSVAALGMAKKASRFQRLRESAQALLDERALRSPTELSSFARGDPPPGLLEIAGALAVPTRPVQQIMQTLCAARLIVEAAGAEPAYLPARPLENITCHDILLAMRATQGQELATRDEPTRAEVYGEFCRIEEAERQAAASVTMLALVNRAQAHKTLTE